MTPWIRWGLAGLFLAALLGLLADSLIEPDKACGNGIPDPGEVCDPGLDDARSCADLSSLLVGGTARCSSDCNWDVSACHTAAAICGDGDVNGREACDPPGLRTACTNLIPNASSAFATCSPDCEWKTEVCGVAESVCGDASIDAGELCDDGNLINGDGCSKRCVPELGGQAVHYDGPSVDARLESASGESICWDRTGRRKLRDRERVKVEYELLLCKLPSGDTVYPVERIRATMRRVREAFGRAGIDLREAGIEYVSLGHDCEASHSSGALANVVRVAQSAHRIPLVFASRIKEAPIPGLVTMGFANFGYAVVLGTTRSTVVIHELGHFFGLLHTHSCVDSISGDRLVDTPHDPGPSWLPFTCEAQQPQTCSQSCGNSPCSGGSIPERANYMSYHQPCQRQFSQEQLDVVRCMVDHDLVWFVDRVEQQRGDPPSEADHCVRFESIGLGIVAGTTFGRSESYGGVEYPEGSTDILYKLRTPSDGLHCVEVRSQSMNMVMTIRDGCHWDDAILSSNFSAQHTLNSRLNVTTREGEATWLALDQQGFSSGQDFELQIREGACKRALTLLAPILLEPLPEATVSTPRVEIRWKSIPNAELYELRVGPDAASLRQQNLCAECLSEIIDSTAVELLVSSGFKRTFWTVRALLGEEQGPFAKARWFQQKSRKKAPILLGHPTLTYPLSGDTLATLTPTFTWEPVESAVWYDVRLGVNADITDEFCNVCLQRRVYKNEFHPDSHTLLRSLHNEEVELFWTVRAGNASQSGPFARPISGFEVEPWLCTLTGWLKIPSDVEHVTLPDVEDDLDSFCGGASSAENVWLLVPEESGVVCIDTENTGFNTVLSVRHRCEQEDTELVCGDNQLEFSVEANQPYFVIVDGAETEDHGWYSLRVRSGSCSY